MSNSFQQRFKGKIQHISKDGVSNILGSKNPDTIYNPNQSSKEDRKFHSVKNTNSISKKDKKQKADKYESSKPQQGGSSKHQTVTVTQKKTQNPFLVSNPFYLDEEQREKQQLQRRERQKLEEQILKAENSKHQKDTKQVTKTSSYSRSLEKKKDPSKQYVRLGGLGANKNDQWQQKKNQADKKQKYSEEVKNNNANRVKPPKPDSKKQEKKQLNTRQKALEYSKNVPKPTLKKQELEEEEDSKQYDDLNKNCLPQEQQLTELQIYEMKHQKLKKMINNQY